MKFELQEKLIHLVKKHPILYDCWHEYHNNSTMRDKVWDQIGLELNQNGNDIKKKWRNIRDTYAKHLKAITNEGPLRELNSKYLRWQWAKHMESLLPHLSFSKDMDLDAIRAYYRGKDEFFDQPNDVRVSAELMTNQKSQRVFLNDRLDPPDLDLLDEDANIELNDLNSGEFVLESRDFDLEESKINNGNVEEDEAEQENGGAVEENELKFIKMEESSEENGGAVEEVELKFIEMEESSSSRESLQNLQSLISPARKSRKRARSSTEILSSVESTIEGLENKRSRCKATALELIFLGYAQIVENFSPERQAAVKLKMAKIINEQELLHQKEQVSKPGCSSFAFRNNE